MSVFANHELRKMYHMASANAEQLRTEAIAAEKERHLREYRTVTGWLESVGLEVWDMEGKVESRRHQIEFFTTVGDRKVTVKVRPSYQDVWDDKANPTKVSPSMGGEMEVWSSSNEVLGMDKQLTFIKTLQDNLENFEEMMNNLFDAREGRFTQLEEADCLVMKLERDIRANFFSKCMKEFKSSGRLQSPNSYLRIEVEGLSKSGKTADEVTVFKADNTVSEHKSGKVRMSEFEGLLRELANDWATEFLS